MKSSLWRVCIYANAWQQFSRTQCTFCFCTWNFCYLAPMLKLFSWCSYNSLYCWLSTTVCMGLQAQASKKRLSNALMYGDLWHRLQRSWVWICEPACTQLSATMPSYRVVRFDLIMTPELIVYGLLIFRVADLGPSPAERREVQRHAGEGRTLHLFSGSPSANQGCRGTWSDFLLTWILYSSCQA